MASNTLGFKGDRFDPVGHGLHEPLISRAWIDSLETSPIARSFRHVSQVARLADAVRTVAHVKHPASSWRSTLALIDALDGERNDNPIPVGSVYNQTSRVLWSSWLPQPGPFWVP